MGMLRILNVAPVQLHLNGLVLHYFCCHSQDKARWISWIRFSKCSHFHLFTCPYKNFKIDYFKVTIRSIVGKNLFNNSVGNPLFPFYWQQCPRQYNKYLKVLLSPDEH
ncbi:hypothetical protein JHK84_055237 [Glycine max]|nr:hypothetical protein JHK86_055211 [Glycine max]KAG5074006.1 hypothetical protein JHK84_055237 [Glycine max]